MFKKIPDERTGASAYSPGGRVLEMMGCAKPDDGSEKDIAYLTEDDNTIVLHIGKARDVVENGIIIKKRDDLATSTLVKSTGEVLESDHEAILEWLERPNTDLTAYTMVFLANVAYYKNQYAFEVIKEKRVIFERDYGCIYPSLVAGNTRHRIRSLYVMIVSELQFFEQLLKTRYSIYLTDFTEMPAEEFLRKYKECPLPNAVINKILERDSLAGGALRSHEKTLLRLAQLITEKEGGNNANLFIDWLKGFITLRGSEYVPDLGSLIRAFDDLVRIYDYNSHRLTDYLTRQSFYYGNFMFPSTETINLRDYQNIAKNVGIEIEEFPSNVTKAHNCITRNNRGLREMSERDAERFVKNCDKVRKLYETKIGDYVVLLPKKHEELFMEGIALSHCVGDYAIRVAKGTTLVGFIRLKDKPEESLYTIEIGDNHKIIQAKGTYNSDVPDEIVDLIDKIEQRWETKLKKGAAA